MGNTKVRESNIELLRNISMFLILVIHANFVSLPKIEYEELLSNTVPSVTRFFIESFGIVAVNVFVFISGWFCIKTRKKNVLSFIYLILFYWFGGGHFMHSVRIWKLQHSLAIRSFSTNTRGLVC